MFPQSFGRLLQLISSSEGQRGRPTTRRRATFRPALERLEDRTVPSIDVWSGIVSDSQGNFNWSEPRNWSGGQIPGPGDVAEFDNTATNFKSTVDTGFTIGGLMVSWGQGKIFVNNLLTLTGTSTWTGADPTGSSWIQVGAGGFTNTGTFNIDATSYDRRLYGSGILTNSGTISLAGDHTLSVANGASLSNTGIFNFTGDGTVAADKPGFYNTGTVEKTGGGGVSTLSLYFNNNGGTIDAESGTLGLNSLGLINGGVLEAGVGGSTTAVLALAYGAFQGFPITVTYQGTFTGSGSGTVALGGGCGLAVTNSGATFNLPGTLFQWDHSTIYVASGGTFTNAGVLNVDTTTGEVDLYGAGTLLNNATMNEKGPSNGILSLVSNATLSNTGTFDFTADANVSNASGTFSNAGTVEKTGGSGVSTISSVFNNNGGTMDAESGTLALATYGDLLNGGLLEAGVGGSKTAVLNLASGATVSCQGSFTGRGSGTITFRTLVITSSGATLNMAGGLFQWSGIIDVSSGGTLTNARGSILTLDTTGPPPDLQGAGMLANSGTINEKGTSTFYLENNATLTNAGGATFNLAGDASISGGTLINVGSFNKTKGIGTSTISTSSFNNTGAVTVKTGTVNISAPVAQVSGSTLTAGTWTVSGRPTTHSTLTISSAGSLTTIGSKARVTLSGPNTTFTNLSGLNTILAGGRFSLLGGRSFTTAGAFTNNGSLTLSPGSLLTVSGSFTQTSTATLNIQMGGTSSSPTIGSIKSTTGAVTLAGALKVTSKVTPAVGSTFTILDNETGSVVGGMFTGLQEGSTFTLNGMTFKISYAGGSNGQSVTVTRMS